ncbi:Aa_trans domain-containing protein [Mucor velutinosus]|uniref:Aa_trans domain-containing protein n=1 Tax=Mucor velutinosus TaxID=708070 RepID=A0AAN7DMP0_9FUNG|nr:Aa_trans domain-containing protein [Mucor velutinosus]
MHPGTVIRFCILSNDLPGQEPSMVIDTIERELAPSTQIRLGRFTTITDENDIHLNSKVVSRRHAKIYVKKSKLLIKDTKSNFGTYVNGVRLAKKKQVSVPHKLESGDIVRIGKDFHGGIKENQRGVLMRIEIDPPASTTMMMTP